MTIHARLKADEEAAEAELSVVNTPEVAEEAKPEAQETDWKAEAKLNEQRFKVLQGKYNAETRRQRDEITALTEQVKKTPEPEKMDRDDDFYEDYPEQKAVDQRQDKFDEELEAMKAEQDTERYTSALSEAVPDWQSVDKDERFISWLSENDDMLGDTRSNLMNDAIADRDVERIAAIINAWKVTLPEETTQPQPQQHQETPRNSAGGDTVTQGSTYTESQVNIFYDDISKGKYRGREVERQQIERELDLAMSQGRIVQG